jgi:hypothetical protein
MVCIDGEFGDKYGVKYGGTSEIQCACVKDAQDQRDTPFHGSNSRFFCGLDF